MLRIMCALALCCLALSGCLPDAQKQLQIAEENARDRDLDVRTIGDIIDIGEPSTVPIQVDGVGLVTGLAGTGHCPSGYHRTMLEQYLLKHNITPGGELRHLGNDVKVRQMLDDPDNALVLVKGFIPPGAHKGDRFDVEIALPANSKTSSLAGGYLELSILRIYEAAAHHSNRPEVAGKLLEGDIFAHAKGKLFVGFGGNTDPHELKHARIWQGGLSRIDRAYAFCMRDDKKSLSIASDIARRINFMYQDDPNSPARRFEFTKQEKLLLQMGNAAHQLNMRQDPFGATANDVAKATKECVIQVRVPAAYRFDHERFARVALYTPLRDNDVKMPRYRQRLQKLVLDPSDCKWALWAALHLEALGRDSIPALKAGLTSDHPFIRFICAESLAYLGSTAGVDMLAELARSQSILAKNCTIALANLSETIARDRLGELLADEDPALRCAAFHALTLLDESDSRLGGKFLSDSFWLYRIPQAPTPMVYFSTSKRAQVVVFGKDVILVPETRMMVGTRREFTVAHSKEQNKFVIKRFTPRGEAERVISNRLDEALNALAELGATYPDVVDFLRQAQVYQAVNCPIVHWSVPEVTVDTLVDAGKGMK
jgi:Flagellar P-ring protein